MKYRKKPLIIDAEQFLSTATLPFYDRGICKFDGSRGRWYMDTLEGPVFLCAGDWIVRGVAGEYYPCKPDIFRITYEAIAEEIGVAT